MTLPALACAVCNNEPAVGVAAIPGMGMSEAYGQDCLDANAHPWWALVMNTSIIGGLEQCAPWWQDMVRDTCAHLNRSLEDFNAEVARDIAQMEADGV